MPERIQRAINLSSADHMRTLEQKEWKHWRTTRGTRQEISFVREAKSGGWRKHLSESAVNKIETAWGSTMEDLGYGVNTNTPMNKFEKSGDHYSGQNFAACNGENGFDSR